MNHPKIVALSRPLWLLLVLSNFGFAFWLNSKFSTYWGWTTSHLSDGVDLANIDFLAIFQFFLFSISLDMTNRKMAVSFNKKSTTGQISAILVQTVSVAIYSLVGLIGFVLIYDRSFSHIFAATGAIGVGVAYVFREIIANIVASIQIQADGLIGINDFIQTYQSSSTEIYQVVQLDYSMVILRDKYDYLVHVPNHTFLSWKYVNVSKQPGKRGSRRKIDLEIGTQNDPERVLHILELAIKYVIKTNKEFFDWHAIRVSKLNEGVVVYIIAYECDPALKMIRSSDIVLRAALRFMKSAGVNLNTDVEMTQPDEDVNHITKRLLNISRMGVLRFLDERQINDLAKSVSVVQCEEGDHLIKQGDTADSMYFISEGSLEVAITDDQNSEIVVATLWPGDCVGEMSLLTGEPRSANVKVKSNSTILLELKKADLQPIFESNPKLVEQISFLLATRKAANDKLLNQEEAEELLRSRIKDFTKKILKFFFNN